MSSFTELMTPWLILAAILIPLIYFEKWIHSHLYGIGWLLSGGNPKTATALYYVILFPGVFVHEFTQYLMAGALNVRIKKMVAWPDAQENGTLRLDFVRIENARWYQAALIGAAPLLVGTTLVWLISNHVLNLTEFIDALGTGDITIIGTAVEHLARTPDFYIWLYLIFAISNAMFPTPADRQGWPLLLAVMAGLVALLLVLGVNGAVLQQWYEDNLARGLEIMTAAFAAVMIVAISSMLFIGFFEEILERITKNKFDYGSAQPEPQIRLRSPHVGREPGSPAPLPLDAPLPSIYNLSLPIPDPKRRAQLPPRKRSAPPVAAQTQTASPSSSQRPGMPGQQPAAASGAPRPTGPGPTSPGATPAGGFRPPPQTPGTPPGQRPGMPGQQPAASGAPRPTGPGPTSPGAPPAGGFRPSPQTPGTPPGQRPGMPGQQPAAASGAPRPTGPGPTSPGAPPTGGFRPSPQTPGTPPGQRPGMPGQQSPPPGGAPRPTGPGPSPQRTAPTGDYRPTPGGAPGQRPDPNSTQSGRPPASPRSFNPDETIVSRANDTQQFRRSAPPPRGTSPFTRDAVNDEPDDDDEDFDDVEYVDFDDL